jgi:predicted nicotinamide N-methyase
VIAYASTFPHNFEGLKLWDSNIVLARYIIMNTHKFKNMNVLEIPSGTGIAGITLRKWTSANKVILADISPEMIQNIRNNMQKNSI